MCLRHDNHGFEIVKFFSASFTLKVARRAHWNCLYS